MKSMETLKTKVIEKLDKDFSTQITFLEEKLFEYNLLTKDLMSIIIKTWISFKISGIRCWVKVS